MVIHVTCCMSFCCTETWKEETREDSEWRALPCCDKPQSVPPSRTPYWLHCLGHGPLHQEVGASLQCFDLELPMKNKGVEQGGTTVSTRSKSLTSVMFYSAPVFNHRLLKIWRVFLPLLICTHREKGARPLPALENLSCNDKLAYFKADSAPKKSAHQKKGLQNYVPVCTLKPNLHLTFCSWAEIFQDQR